MDITHQEACSSSIPAPPPPPTPVTLTSFLSVILALWDFSLHVHTCSLPLGVLSHLPCSPSRLFSPWWLYGNRCLCLRFLWPELPWGKQGPRLVPGAPQPLHRATQQAADRTPPECVGGVGSKMPALMLVLCPALRGMEGIDLGGGKCDRQAGDRIEITECQCWRIAQVHRRLFQVFIWCYQRFFKRIFVVLQVSIHQEDILTINILCLIKEL